MTTNTTNTLTAAEVIAMIETGTATVDIYTDTDGYRPCWDLETVNDSTDLVITDAVGDPYAGVTITVDGVQVVSATIDRTDACDYRINALATDDLDAIYPVVDRYLRDAAAMLADDLAQLDGLALADYLAAAPGAWSIDSHPTDCDTDVLRYTAGAVAVSADRALSLATRYLADLADGISVILWTTCPPRPSVGRRT